MAFDVLSTVFGMRKGISAPGSHFSLFSRSFSLFSWKGERSHFSLNFWASLIPAMVSIYFLLFSSEMFHVISLTLSTQQQCYML